MDAAVRAWLLSQLGTATDLTDLETRYTRLGTARATALEILRGRLADLLAQPANVTVSSVVGINTGENIRALERQIAALQAGEPPAPDESADPDDDTADTTLGLLYLIERPRR